MPTYYRDDNNVEVVSEDGSSSRSVASDLIWAIATIILVGMLVWTVFYSGILDRPNKHKIGVDVNISAPSR
jgi:hypothetical protein